MIQALAICCVLVLGETAAGVRSRVEDAALLKENFQVIQRNSEGAGRCRVALPRPLAKPTACAFEIDDARGIVQSGSVQSQPIGGDQTVLLKSIPVGGPYTVTVDVKGPDHAWKRSFRNVLVGDIWVLGGQSNMYGIAAIKEPLPALPYLNMLDCRHIHLDAHWCAGVPPIHRIPEQFAAFTLKSQHPEWSEAQVQHKLADGSPVGGIECSYFFAKRLYRETGVPIGLIPCATGGALAIWDPGKREQNRYGFLAHQVATAGGRVKGLLFYQGEQDAIFGDEQQPVASPSLIDPLCTYGQQFKAFVHAFRHDFGADAPVLFAQICRHHQNKLDRTRGWEILRETQRQLPEIVPRSHCVPTVDLDVVDGLHLDYESQKRLGERMAFLAVPYVKPAVGPRSEIKLASVRLVRSPRPVITVEFSGVTGRLRAPGRPTGFQLKDKTTGKALDWIYKIDLEPARPQTAILHVAIENDRDVVLYYGAGMAPYVNIVDDNDMPLPAFGPIDVK
jgi:sialate O-acetylesterase